MVWPSCWIGPAGGRRVCTEHGIDSDRRGDEMVFLLGTVIAEDFLRRVKANFQSGVDRAERKQDDVLASLTWKRSRSNSASPQKTLPTAVGPAEVVTCLSGALARTPRTPSDPVAILLRFERGAID